jgi:hypothetical protein
MMNTISVPRESHLILPSNRVHAAQSLSGEIFFLIKVFHSMVHDGQYGGFPDGHARVL